MKLEPLTYYDFTTLQTVKAQIEGSWIHQLFTPPSHQNNVALTSGSDSRSLVKKRKALTLKLNDS